MEIREYKNKITERKKDEYGKFEIWHDPSTGRSGIRGVEKKYENGRQEK